MFAPPFAVIVTMTALLAAPDQTRPADSPPRPPTSKFPPQEEVEIDPYVPGDGVADERGGIALSVGVQVNTNAAGQNILNDAANEPSIAVDPLDPRRIVIGWRQFDNISSNFRQAGWAYSHDSGRTWTFPGKLTPGTFRSDPVISVDRNHNFYYCNIKSNLTADVFKSTDGGVSWGGPVAAFGGDKEWMIVDSTTSIGSGHIYVNWRTDGANCCGPNSFTRSTNGGSSFISPIAPPQGLLFGNMAMGGTGDVFITGTSQTLANVMVVARSFNAKNSGVTPSFAQSAQISFGADLVLNGTPNPGGLLGQTNVAVDRSGGATDGYVYCLASAGPVGSDPLDVRFCRSTNGGVNWSTPIRVNDDVSTSNWQWFGTMSVAPNGRIDVVWNDTRGGGGNHTLSQLYYAYSTNGGVSFSANVALTPQFNSTVGWPNQNKIGDYYDMVSDNVGANIAYSATFNGEQDVYFFRIGDYDCNNNGVGDASDIAGGASQDCNGNDIPDECEYLAGPLACDVNCDGSINPFDINSFLAQLGATPPAPCSPCAGDANGDGTVNPFDINAFLACLGA